MGKPLKGGGAFVIVANASNIRLDTPLHTGNIILANNRSIEIISIDKKDLILLFPPLSDIDSAERSVPITRERLIHYIIDNQAVVFGESDQ